MSDIAIRVENVSKLYRLGVINHGTLYHDFQSWWAWFLGREDPNKIISTEEQDGGMAAGTNQKFYALQDVSFDIRRGEAFGIIGRNGAGKSTILKIISRIVEPTAGCVKLRGKVTSLLDVSCGFHPELTGRENVFLRGAILGMSHRDVAQRFDDIVAFSEIERFIDTPVKRYSTGMGSRLAFSVAVHLVAEIVILDEVLAVGDMFFHKKCMEKMESVIKKEGRTIVFVSHDLNSIKKLCDRGVFLQHGHAVEVGEITTVTTTYQKSQQAPSPAKIAIIPAA